MSDSLQFLPPDHWHRLKEVFRRDWPRHMSGYTALATMEDVIKRGCDYGFKVYCPYGNVESGMVAVNKKGEFTELVMNCLEDTSEFEKALRTTQILNYKSFQVAFGSKHVMDVVHRVAKEVWKATVKEDIITETFLLTRKTPFDVDLPQDFTFKHMTLDHIEVVDSTWPHRYPNSTRYFEMKTKAQLGYGLFHQNELLAWVYIRETGALAHLYTLEKHRRKGYGEMVIKLISNVLMAQDRPVIAYCVRGNKGARNMYVKLAFDNTLGDVHWTTFVR